MLLLINVIIYNVIKKTATELITFGQRLTMKISFKKQLTWPERLTQHLEEQGWM